MSGINFLNMDPTCCTNKNAALINHQQADSIIPLKSNFYYDETTMYGEHNPLRTKCKSWVFPRFGGAGYLSFKNHFCSDEMI